MRERRQVGIKRSSTGEGQEGHAVVCALFLPLAFCVLSSAVGFGTVVARADEQPPQTVTLAEALQLLETQNPDTLAARLQIAQAEAEHLAARLYANPTLSVDADNFPVGHTTPQGLSVGQTIGSTVRLDQPLVLWGKRGLRIEGAAAGIAAAQEQERDTLRQLRAAVKDAFYRSVHDARLFRFTAENQQRYQRIVELNERRFRSGDISEVEFRKIQLENLKYLTDTEEAQRSLSESRQLLGRLIGTEHAVTPNGELTAPDVSVDASTLTDVAMENRPDLAALQRARMQADLALQFARRDRYPDVTVGADYTHSEFVISGDNRNSMGFGFNLPLPLLNQNQGEIAKAEVALRQAETDSARLRLDITQEVHDALLQYESTRRLRQTFESGYLDHAKLAVSAAEASYRIGGASLIELLDTERTYTTTQTDYLDTIFAARSSLIALEKAIGKDLSGD